MPVPTSISSNQTGLSYALEASLQTLPGTPIWYALEPNSYSEFGATFKNVARETINSLRQRLKGTITDETVKGGFNIDLTQHNLTRLLQGFFYALAIEKPATQPLNGTQIALTGVTATQFQAATGLAGFLVGSLMNAKGFINSANNGLMHVTVVAAGALTVDTALTAETPPAAAQLETCGFRCASGDIALTVVGNTVVLTSTVLDFTTLGLSLGEWIYVGGDAVANQFATAADTGYCRIASIATHSLVFDQVTFVPAADAGTGKLIDLYFGKLINNATTAANIVRTTYQLERTLGNDGTGTQVEYIIGAVPDSFTLNMPDASKIACDLAFVGLSVQNFTGATGVKAGTRVGLPGEAAINTSQSVYLSRLAVISQSSADLTPLFAYATSIKLDIKNTATPNKAIGVLGGFDVNEGDFAVSGTMTAYFSTVAAAAAIQNNSSVSLQTIIAQANTGMIFDIPFLTLGGGLNKVEKDKPITVELTQDAAKCPNGYTMLACFFEYLPTIAM